MWTPSLGRYSSELGIVQAHVAMMRYAKCKAAIASWWGSDSPYSARIDTCLKASEGTRFRWALYYEKESVGDPTVAAIVNDLDYVAQRWASHPNYLHLDHKPVLFVYEAANDGAAMAARWQQANAGRFHLCLKVFDGFRTTPAQPDSWHQYAPANNYEDLSPWSVSVSPGFAMAGQPERLARDIDRFRGDVARMEQTPARFHLITTFNEWGEGTAVEPSIERGTQELDALAGTR